MEIREPSSAPNVRYECISSYLASGWELLNDEIVEAVEAHRKKPANVSELGACMLGIPLSMVVSLCDNMRMLQRKNPRKKALYNGYMECTGRLRDFPVVIDHEQVVNKSELLPEEWDFRRMIPCGPHFSYITSQKCICLRICLRKRQDRKAINQ